MPVTIVAGVQWGDEGKGKIVDILAQDADMVIRCQGGPNAGHTVVNDRGRFVLHTLPSGVFSNRAVNVLAPGVVIDPVGLAAEIEGLRDAGVAGDRLVISERAHVILPYHKTIDELDDCRRPVALRIGTTGQGVGPAYADKASRIGMRAGDLRNRPRLIERLGLSLDHNNALLRARYNHPGFTLADILAAIEPALDTLLGMIGDTAEAVHNALDRGDRILLEGQLGVMRDLDWGAYPFVTSSCPTPAGLAAGAGVPPQQVDRVVGVMKAYTTSVGEGPFPTELHGDALEQLRTRGGEFGATTGRPRRCGWLDLPAAAWACRVGGFTEIALTKLDILDGVDRIPVCTEYRRDGVAMAAELASYDWADIEPVYEDWTGWAEPTSSARTLSDLPSAALAYVKSCETSIGQPISMISVGQARDATIKL